jgi:hypothetical protein
MPDEPDDRNNDGRRTFAGLQVANSVVWAATLLGVAVAAKASDNFIYELLVLLVGFSLSWGVINTAERRDQRT